MPITFSEPNVCVGENLTTDEAGVLRLEPWSVPRLVADVKANSGGDTTSLMPSTSLPGKLLIEQKVLWRNDTPTLQSMLIRVIRGPKYWLTSSPNAIQFRDRWSYAVDYEPEPPTTIGIFNSQVGSALDTGTNTVAEPLPGRQWMWADANTADEWVRPLEPGQQLNVWYRCYVWTPPPFSDNANKNSPQHEAAANWTRIQLIAFPNQGSVVAG